MFLDTDRLTSLILFQGKKHFGSPLSTQDMFAHQLLMKTRKTTLGTGLKPQHRFFCHINFYSNQVPIWRRIEHLGGNDNKTCLKPSYSLLKPKTPWLILTDKLVVGESDDGNANKASAVPSHSQQSQLGRRTTYMLRRHGRTQSVHLFLAQQRKCDRISDLLKGFVQLKINFELPWILPWLAGKSRMFRRKWHRIKWSNFHCHVLVSGK